MQCLIKLDTPERSEAKMELVLMTNELMPEGRPQYLSMIKYPTVRSLIEKEGRKKMLAILVLMVKDFCSSVNVVRNMNEDQMIEAGAMLLEECGNFRMEDYMMMFNMAKRGAFPEVKIMDRIDMQLISAIMDAYWKRRAHEGEKALDDEIMKIEGTAPGVMERNELKFVEGKGYVIEKSIESKMDNFSGFIGEVVKNIKANHITQEELDAARAQIKANPNYKNPYEPK